MTISQAVSPMRKIRVSGAGPVPPTQTREPFYTGSRRYGTPGKDSDLDLVMLVDTGTEKILREQSNTIGGPVRYANLNLILCTDWQEFDAWKTGSEMLEAMRPVTREQAIACFDKVFSDAGLRQPGNKVDPETGRRIGPPS